MLNVFTLAHGRLVQQEIDSLEALAHVQPVWVDLEAVSYTHLDVYKRQDHLRAQIAGMRLGDEDRAALEVLIESLDGDGYLADPLLEIAERLAEMLGVSTGEANDELLGRLNIALKWLQSLEPTGVGARSLPECLILQLRTTPACAARLLAERICEHHLDLLSRRCLLYTSRCV